MRPFAYRNKKYFEQYRFYSSSDNSFVPPIVFHDTKSTFCLDGSVHPQKCSLDTFEIFYHFLMHRCKFAVDPNSTVFICLFTLFCVWTAGAIFTLIHFFLTPILVSLYVFLILKVKSFPVWATHNPVFPDWKIYCTKWIFMILLVSSLFLEHRQLLLNTLVHTHY